MQLNLNDKRVLITGSSKGIGFGIAKNFLIEGAKVCITSRGTTHLNKAKKEFSEFFGREKVVAFECDFTDIENIESLKGKIVEKWGGIDIVVSNIGDGQSSSEPLPNNQFWERTWGSNFESALHTSRIFLPLLEESNGNILFISSIAGMEAFGAPVDYSTAKAAVIALAKNMSKKLANKVRVNVLAPGNIWFQDGVWDRKMNNNKKEVMSNIELTVPMNRLGTVQEIADTAIFICSDRSSFTTGAVFIVDGGQTHSV